MHMISSNDLLKRTPVRLAGAFTILFALTVVALVAVLYLTSWPSSKGTSGSASRRPATRCAHRSRTRLRRAGRRRRRGSRSVRDFDSIFLLARARTARSRPATCKNVRVFTGWAVLDRAWLPTVADKGDPDDRFFALWTPVSKGHLLVGGSDREIREVQRILLHGLGWGLMATVLLAAGSAVFLSRRAQQKIDVFATTLPR